MAEQETMTVHRGVGASDGIAVGPAVVIDNRPVEVPEHSAPAVALVEALATVHLRLTELSDRAAAAQRSEAAEVLSAQALMAMDPMLRDGVLGRIEAGTGLADAIDETVDEIAAMFAAIDDPYIAARADDVAEVADRLRRVLAGVPDADLALLDEPSVVIAAAITVAETAQLDPDVVLGFATEKGGPTSHVAIVARSLGVAAVVGVGGIASAAAAGTTVALDGASGEVVVAPDQEALADFEYRRDEHSAQITSAALYRGRTVAVGDNAVSVAANVGNPDDIERAVREEAEGIGLFRSEFLFLDRPEAPSEQEQLEIYSEAARSFAEPVVIRAFDIGGDKQIDDKHEDRSATSRTTTATTGGDKQSDDKPEDGCAACERSNYWCAACGRRSRLVPEEENPSQKTNPPQGPSTSERADSNDTSASDEEGSPPKEDNPFLGVRGARLYSSERQLYKPLAPAAASEPQHDASGTGRVMFEIQVRAVARAGVDGDLWLMLPMISAVAEVIEISAIVEGVIGELAEAGVAHRRPRLGVMIEVPSVALIADAVADHVDFFSIGTNDLTQYTLAADRGNEELDHLQDPLHPAVLALCMFAVAAARRAQLPVSVCGLAAADPAGAALFAAMGVDKLSVSAPFVNRIKAVLDRIDHEKTADVLETALAAADADEVRAAAATLLDSKPPSLDARTDDTEGRPIGRGEVSAEDSPPQAASADRTEDTTAKP